jgi:hypothetical protein
VGFSISWVAVKGKESEILLRDLGLAFTGERDELPAESPIAGASLPGSWYVIIFDRYEHPFVRDDVLKRLSEGCELVAAGAEEHVMCSSAAAWRNGERIWWIRHDAQEDVYDLAADGSLPQGFDLLRRRGFDEQNAAGGRKADVDVVFDIPLYAAKLTTGFSHDETEPDQGFAVLADATT